MRYLYVLGGVIAVLALLMFLPMLLGRILDPLNARKIRVYCESRGLSEVVVEPFPNHYGVQFMKGGRKLYAKCRVVGRTIKWKGASPDEMTVSPNNRLQRSGEE